MHYALMKKSPAMYEKFGFGLWFNNNFNASVLEAIERDRKLSETTQEEIDEWLTWRDSKVNANE